jgi:hypothetical protein
MRLAHYDYTDRAGAVGFLPWIHGAKVVIFCLRHPKTPNKSLKTPLKPWVPSHGTAQVMKSGLPLGVREKAESFVSFGFFVYLCTQKAKGYEENPVCRDAVAAGCQCQRAVQN